MATNKEKRSMFNSKTLGRNPKMMKTRTFSLLTLAAALAMAGSAHSAVLLYEGFDYSLDNGDAVVGENGGTGGWTGAWVDAKTEGPTGGHLFTTGLTYTNGATLVTTGGAMEDPDSTDLESSRSYDANLIGTSGTYWFSYLIQTSDSKFEEIKFESSAVRGEADGFGTDNALGNSDGSVGGTLSDVLAAGTVSVTGDTMFVLGKMEVIDGGNDTLSVWFNTDLTLAEGALGTPDSTVTAELVQGNDFLFSTGGGHLGILDEIRLGETYADVTPIPEPSSLALLGLVGMTLLTGHRRR